MILLVAVCGGLPVRAAVDSSVLERSERKTPQWIYSNPEEAILVSVEAPSLSEAREGAVAEIARRMVLAVAVNVRYSSATRMESGAEGEREEFSSNFEMAAASLPSIRGISLSDAEAAYWEKRQEKRSGRIFYALTVLYPFPDAYLEQLRREFDEQDSARSAELASLKEGLSSPESSVAIEEAAARLEALEDYFFDSARKKEAAALRTAYLQLYRGLALKTERVGPGMCRFCVVLRGKPLKVTARPQVTSECASRISVRPQSDGIWYVVSFDTSDCLPEEENTLLIRLRLRDARLSERVIL